MDRHEEDEFKRRMASKPREFQLIIKYSVAPIMMSPVSNDYGDENISLECLPVSILKGDDWPINISDYHIQTDHTGSIKDVKSLQYGAIKYIAQCID